MDFSDSAVLRRLSNALQNPVNKVEGGFSMDNLQAVAQEIARLVAMEIDPIPNHVLLDTAEGEYLDRKGLDYNEARMDREDDNSYRSRIFQKIQNPLTSGNKNHYIYWAKKVAGVGDAKCIPCWDGAGTVKVIVLSSEKGIPSEKTLQAVRNYIEENRPVGAAVTVVAATPVSITIQVSITLEDGSSLADAKVAIEQYIRAYLDEIAFQGAPLSYYRIGDRIFNAPGVQDITSYTVNGGMISIPAATGEFFRLLEVVVSAAK